MATRHQSSSSLPEPPGDLVGKRPSVAAEKSPKASDSGKSSAQPTGAGETDRESGRDLRSTAESGIEEPEISTLDQELVEATRAVVERRRQLQALLDKAESKKGEVKESIYRRVSSDYRGQLQSIDAELSPLRERLVQQLRSIRKDEHKLRRRLEEVQEDLDELRFRHELGEFGGDRKEQEEKRMLAVVDRLEARLGVVDSSYQEAQELIGEAVDEVMSQVVAETLSDERTALLATPQKLRKRSVPAPPRTAEAPPLPPQPPAATPGTQPKSGEVMERSAAGAKDKPRTKKKKDRSKDTAPVEMAETPPSEGTAPLERAFLTPKKPAKGPATVLNRSDVVLGRSAMSDIVVEGPTVSRRHAVIRYVAGSYQVEDVSSGGGVMVNGETVQTKELVSGDELVIGAAVFEFRS